MIEKSLSFSLYDVISTIVPGAGFLFLVYLTQPSISFIPPEAVLLGFLVFGFLFGLLFLALGNLLYGTYIHPNNYTKGTLTYWFAFVLHKLVKFVVRQDYALKGLDVKEQVKELIKKEFGLEKLDHLSLFQFADLVSQKHSYTDRADLLAKEGAFRAFTAMTLFAFIYLRFLGGFGYPLWLWLLVLTAVLRLLLYGHNYYQKIRHGQIYLLAYIELKNKND